MKIIIFGTGQIYKKFKKWFRNIEVIAFLDNNVKKQGTKIEHYARYIPILSPEEGVRLPADHFYVMSTHVQEMAMQLLQLGVSEEKICYTFDIMELYHENEKSLWKRTVQTGNADISQPSICMLSDDLKLSGAQYALLYAAIVLKKNGWNVVITSPEGGKLEEYIKKENITCILDERLSIGKLRDIEWIANFNLIFVNSILNYHLLLDRNIDQPVIWWSHETEHYFQFVSLGKFATIQRDNLYVFAVSNRGAKSIRKFNKNLYSSLLPVCVDSTPFNHTLKDCTDKMIFAVIGEVCDLKGQDILLDAVEQLDEKEKSCAEFWLVGRHNSLFYEKIHERIVRLNNIKVKGERKRSEIEEIYKNVDVLVCSSRVENLCMAVIEAASHSIMPIISSAAAVSEYFVDKDSCLIFQSEDSKSLADQIRWCLNYPNKMFQMGVKSHIIYQNNFTSRIFEENLLQIVENTGN